MTCSPDRKAPSKSQERTMTSVFERYLTVCVALSILAGILLGKLAPGLARSA